MIARLRGTAANTCLPFLALFRRTYCNFLVFLRRVSLADSRNKFVRPHRDLRRPLLGCEGGLQRRCRLGHRLVSLLLQTTTDFRLLHFVLKIFAVLCEERI